MASKCLHTVQSPPHSSSHRPPLCAVSPGPSGAALFMCIVLYYRSASATSQFYFQSLLYSSGFETKLSLRDMVTNWPQGTASLWQEAVTHCLQWGLQGGLMGLVLECSKMKIPLGLLRAYFCSFAIVTLADSLSRSILLGT